MCHVGAVLLTLRDLYGERWQLAKISCQSPANFSNCGCQNVETPPGTISTSPKVCDSDSECLPLLWRWLLVVRCSLLANAVCMHNAASNSTFWVRNPKMSVAGSRQWKAVRGQDIRQEQLLPASLPACQHPSLPVLSFQPVATMQQSTQQNCSSSQRSHYSNVFFDLPKSSSPHTAMPQPGQLGLKFRLGLYIHRYKLRFEKGFGFGFRCKNAWPLSVYNYLN